MALNHSFRALRRLILGGVAATVMASLSGIAQAQDKISIMVDWAPHGMHAGLHLAVQKGWFKEAGLNVEVLDGRGSVSTIQQVAAGKIDIGFAQLGAMAPAIANGVPVTSVMGFVRAGDNGLVVPIAGNYKTLKDLVGKKIVVPNGSGTAPFLDAFFKAGGVSRNDIQVVNVDSQSMVATYGSGQVEGALSTVAFFAPIVSETRPSSGILFADVGLRIPGYGLVVQKDAIDKRAEMLAKVVAVNKRVWDYIFSGKEDEAVDAMLAQRSGLRLDRKVMMGQLKMYMPLFATPATKGRPLGWQAESDWQEALKSMEQASVIKPGWKTVDFFTNKFIPQ
jgi:NitT/TauT family transport system substrate-binding protein